MYTPSRWLAGFALLVSAVALARPAAGQPEKVLPPGNRAARLVLTYSGPHAPVTALAFTPDGSALFVAGFDKQVRRYTLGKDGYAAAGSFRVPIGPGNGGLINALAVSPDGKWVAAAGRAPIRGEVWSGGEDALLEDTRYDSDEMRGDLGIIYLFDPKTLDGVTAIRGQLGEVQGLAFAHPAPAAGPVLVSAGIERNRAGTYSGALRVFDAKTGAQLAEHTGLPNTTVPPGLAAWADKKGLKVALAWDVADAKPGKLLLWDDPKPTTKPASIDDGAFNATVAVRHDKDGAAEVLLTGGYHFGTKKSGGLTVRDLAGAEKSFIPISDAAGTPHLPVGVAAFWADGKGVVAVVSRIAPAMKGGALRHELRLTTADGATKVELENVDEKKTAVLAASPDGRFVAVGGFRDNRVEVYSVAELLAGRGRVPQKLIGEKAGFAKVAFLEGEKLWLGLPADTLEQGGVVLDIAAKGRTAVPRGPNEKLKLDQARGAAPVISDDLRSVAVTVGAAREDDIGSGRRDCARRGVRRCQTGLGREPRPGRRDRAPRNPQPGGLSHALRRDEREEAVPPRRAVAAAALARVFRHTPAARGRRR